VEHLVPYSTAQPSIFKSDQLLPVKNLKLLVLDHPKIAEHVITVLVNLSVDGEVLENLATDGKFLDTVLARVTVRQFKTHHPTWLRDANESESRSTPPNPTPICCPCY